MGDGFAHRPNHRVFLEAAVKQGAGECIELTLAGDQGRRLQPVMVTIAATLLFPKSHIAYKTFHVIPVLNNDAQFFFGGKQFQRILAPPAFRVGVNVVAREKAHHRIPLISQDFQGIDRTGATTGMQQDFHGRSPNRAVPMRTRVAPS